MLKLTIFCTLAVFSLNSYGAKSEAFNRLRAEFWYGGVKALKPSNRFGEHKLSNLDQEFNRFEKNYGHRLEHLPEELLVPLLRYRKY